MRKLQLIGQRVAIAALLLSGFGGPTYAAERAPSEEERIAPLVSKQNCWGGGVKYVLETHKFEVEDALCADGSFYHLEFDFDLNLVEKRLVRKALAK
jgi:hypothetical protein